MNIIKTQNQLRYDVKSLKAFYNIPYKTISSAIGIRQDSLSQWLSCEFNLSAERTRALEQYIDKTIKGEQYEKSC